MSWVQFCTAEDDSKLTREMQAWRLTMNTEEPWKRVKGEHESRSCKAYEPELLTGEHPLEASPEFLS